MHCRCGCGTAVKGRKVFVNKEHQLKWMRDGGASQMNALQPVEAKATGGHVAGTNAVETGRLLEAGMKGAEKSREIARRFRESNVSQTSPQSEPSS